MIVTLGLLAIFVAVSLLDFRRSWRRRLEVAEGALRILPAMLARLDAIEEELLRVRERLHQLANELAVVKGRCDLCTHRPPEEGS
jgi:hypothetical protein